MNKEEKLISIIVPAYNVEKYIRKCLDSIIGQDYKNWEIILINDGSTDYTPEICDEYGAKDSRIRVIHQTNAGLSVARNIGLDCANGHYLAFIDSDDYVKADYLSVLATLLETTDSDIAQCSFHKIQETSSNSEIPNDNDQITIKEYSGTDFLNNLYVKGFKPNNVLVWNKLCKKEIWNEIRFPAGLVFEDHYVTPRIIDNANKISVTSQKLYYYVQREGSITNSTDINNIIRKQIDFIHIMDDRIELFKSKNYIKLAIWTYYPKGRWLKKLYQQVKKLSDKKLKKEHLAFIKKDLDKNLKFYLRWKYTKTDLMIKIIAIYISLSFKKL